MRQRQNTTTSIITSTCSSENPAPKPHAAQRQQSTACKHHTHGSEEAWKHAVGSSPALGLRSADCADRPSSRCPSTPCPWLSKLYKLAYVMHVLWPKVCPAQVCATSSPARPNQQQHRQYQRHLPGDLHRWKQLHR